MDTGTSFVPKSNGLDSSLTGLGALPDDVRDDLEGKSTMDELELIIKNSSNNKSQGLDGLCYEFYKGTWDVIKTVM